MEWLTLIAPGYGPDGTPILSVLAKGTYAFAHGKKCLLEKTAIPFHEKDEFYDEGTPMSHATKHELDQTPFKPLTDVILHACAHPPKGKQAYSLDVGVMVGTHRKVLKVFGDRKVVFKVAGFAFSDPEPFDSIRLDYSNAYGGVDKKSVPGTDFSYPKNRVGKGFVIKNDPQALQGLLLPNLEEMDKLLTPANIVMNKFENWPKWPDPAAFGICTRNFYPRINMMGLTKRDYVDAESQRILALQSRKEVGVQGQPPPPPAMPLMNPEAYNAAPPGLKLPYLKGDEAIKMRFLDAEFPAFEFGLPGDKPQLWIDVGQGKQKMEAVLQTVEIYKETNQCTMLWRGSVQYGGPESLKHFKKFEFGT